MVTQIKMGRAEQEKSRDFVADKESGDTVDDEEKACSLEVLKNIYAKENFPKGYQDWSLEEQYDYLMKLGGDYLDKVPESLRVYALGLIRHGDCGRSSTERPDWLDMEKFRKGQEFAQRNFFGLSAIILCGLKLIYSFEDGLKPIIFTKKTNTPYGAFVRFLSTQRRIKLWYTSDPWTKGSKAYSSTQAVRKQHLDVRRALCERSNAEIDETCKIPNAWCPMRSLLMKDFQTVIPETDVLARPYVLISESDARPKGLNQTDMAATQFAFVGLAVLYPKQFGIVGTDEELDAFCHMWRGIGYLIGIEDAFNFCNGSYEEVKQRSKDFIEVWIKPNFREIAPEWEHMSRCLCVGVQYYFSLLSYEAVLAYLLHVLDVPMPGLHASMSYGSKIMFYVHRSFPYLSRIPGFNTVLNKMLEFAMDKALKFDEKKHEALRQLSAETISRVSASA